MSDKCNCYRFSPRDSLSGAVAQIADYLSKHPGWNETELRAFVDGLISHAGVESFNGRTGTVTLDKNDVNNLKIASAYFAESNESIDSLDLVSLYNNGVRFVFTDFNNETKSYNLSFVLDYSSDSGNVVYYPISADSIAGGNVISVNGKSGQVELKIVDVSNGNSSDENAYIFIDEAEDYPDIVAPDSNKLGGQNPSYYATTESVSAITPDDTEVDGKPWTSKNIVDSLCMPLEATGNPVTVYPVENYPMGVKVSWEPVQEGSGDPSPQNIRPITGRDAVSVTRCRKNLIDVSRTEKGTFDALTGEPIDGVNKQERTTYDIACAAENQMVYSNPIAENGRAFFWGENGYIGTLLLNNDRTFTPPVGSMYMRMASASSGFIDAQLELGSTATPYEPYTGSTTDIALPQTVYGGTLDMETGVLTVDKKLKTLNGGEAYAAYTNIDAFMLGVFDGTMATDNSLTTKWKCTHFPSKPFYSTDYFNGAADAFAQEAGGSYMVAFRKSGIAKGEVDAFKAWIKSQYDSGTPVQFWYEINKPYTIQLDPKQIAALSGVNTIYTNAGTLAVTGREDPRHTLVELKNAIISLGGNI